MRKNVSRFLALLLSVGMVVSAVSWNIFSFALEDSSNPKTNQTRTQQNNYEMKAEHSVEVTLGNADTGATYKDLWELFADKSLSGDIIVKLLSDSTTTVSRDGGKVVEVPDRFTSLSFQADEKRELWIHQTNSIIQYSSLFANGKNITIGENVTVPYYCYIFGGSYNKDVTGNPVITIDGKITNNIYGGGLNGTLKGSATIIINGYVGGVYGGGYAKGDVSEYEDTALQKTANVTGDVKVTLNESGQTASIAGGGRADTNNTAALDDKIGFFLTANVEGSVSLTIDGSVKEIRGGGEAGDSIAPAYTAYEATADIGNNISITFGSKSQSNSSFGMHLFGGGYAQTGDRERPGVRSAQANVGGSISISVEEDAAAGSGQDSKTAFNRFFGGGYAQGPYSSANVKGNTTIVTVRPAWESEMGIVGGGDAVSGGTANVNGQASITVKGIKGQYAGYENANAIIGGGFAGYGPNNYMPKVSTANVGSTKIIITDSANLATGGKASIIGGGFAYGSDSASVESEYDKCPVQANVENDTNVYISNGALISSRVHGGGIVNKRGQAVVKGDASIRIGDGCQLKSQVYGGGYVYGTTSISDATLNADVIGSTSIEAGNSSLNQLFGSGYAAAENGSANTHNVSISLSNTTLDWLFGSGYATAKNSSAHAKDVSMSLTGTTLTSSYYYGGWASGENSKTDADTASVMITDSKVNGFISGAGISSKIQNSTELTVSKEVNISSIRQIQDVFIQNNGALTLKGNDWPVNGIGNIDIASSGKLIFSDSSLSSGSWQGPIISGNLSGSGALEMPAGKQFYVYGTIKGTLQLTLSGTPKEGDTCLTAAQGGNADVTLADVEGMGLLRQGGAAERQDWIVASAFTITASVDGGHGRISPEGDISISPGGSQTFTFEPEVGYKVDVVKVDDQAVEVSGNTYTFENVDQDHTLTVSFDLMKHEDIEDAIENLTPSDPEVDPPKEDVLDVKIAYESLPEEEKALVKDEALKELNDQLANLSEVEIKLETHSTLESKVNAENLSSMVDAITKEEARELKQGAIDKITLKLLVTTADASDEKIEENETEHTIGMHMDISVLKIVGSSGKEEKVESTKLPIRMVFDIPKELQGKNRQFFLLHKHEGSVEALPDLDQEETTLTAESSRFSPYAIAYKKTGGQNPTPTPPHNTGSYTIKTSHTTGGTISPSGQITVKGGKEITFAMTPKKGYVIKDVIVDGQSVGVVRRYTFKSVQKSHTIKVVFTRDIASVAKIKLQANSSLTKKNHIYVKWKAVKGSLAGLDGYEVFRSTKRNSGYGKTPFFQTKNTHYTNSKSLKKGTKYYYKIRGYVKINGKRYYTSWSTKAYRAVPKAKKEVRK